MTLKLHMRRWRCCNKTRERQTFVERLPEIATPSRAGRVAPPNCFISSVTALDVLPDRSMTGIHILQNLRDVIQAQLSRATGSSARPLLPGQVSDNERDVMISPSLRDKHGGAAHRELTALIGIRFHSRSSHATGHGAFRKRR
ncbi:hypothetical protein [Methylocystis sp.]|uniref:hypothetical protein n=1 Tax=Methylocystis sp. TaxID=1911079 RepID=UPI002733346F|nr:hypothetical protein [Methylocystis sp.]MDP3552591.1 hypothetical protein [Methylocystis sp.]